MNLQGRGGYGVVYSGRKINKPSEGTEDSELRVAIKMFFGTVRSEFVELEILFARILDTYATTPELIDTWYENHRFFAVWSSDLQVL